MQYVYYNAVVVTVKSELVGLAPGRNLESVIFVLTFLISAMISFGSLEDVVFMLQVNRSDLGLISPPASLTALWEQKRKTVKTVKTQTRDRYNQDPNLHPGPKPTPSAQSYTQDPNLGKPFKSWYNFFPI
jgi:hypothetical protein